MKHTPPTFLQQAEALKHLCRWQGSHCHSWLPWVTLGHTIMQDRRPTTELNLGHIWREEHKQNAFGAADVLGSCSTTGEHCTVFTVLIPSLQGTRGPNQSATFHARGIEDRANKTHRYDGRDTSTIRLARTHLSGSVVVFLFACTSVSPVPKVAGIYSH